MPKPGRAPPVSAVLPQAGVTDASTDPLIRFAETLLTCLGLRSMCVRWDQQSYQTKELLTLWLLRLLSG